MVRLGLTKNSAVPLQLRAYRNRAARHDCWLCGAVYRGRMHMVHLWAGLVMARGDLPRPRARLRHRPLQHLRRCRYASGVHHSRDGKDSVYSVAPWVAKVQHLFRDHISQRHDEPKAQAYIETFSSHAYLHIPVQSPCLEESASLSKL